MDGVLFYGDCKLNFVSKLFISFLLAQFSLQSLPLIIISQQPSIHIRSGRTTLFSPFFIL